jgi:hypothetical protein
MKKLFVFTFAALLLIGLSVPAMADVNLYGRIYFDTYVLSADKEAALGRVNWAAGSPSAGANAEVAGAAPSNPQAPVAGGTSGNDDTDLIWGMDQIITRFGARFQSGKLSGNVEIRPFNGSYYRHWWGAYDFGSFEILWGKWWDPLFFASQGVNNVFGGGYAYGANPTGDAAARTPMVRLKVGLPDKLGEWYLAFQENSGSNSAGIPSVGARDVDITIPKIATSLRLNFAPTSWLLYGAYQTYDEVGRAASGAETDYSVDSWEIGLSGNAAFGPLSFGLNIWTGQNLQDHSNSTASGPFRARYNAFTNGIEDVDMWGFQVHGKFKFNDMVSFEVCYQGADNSRRDVTDNIGDDEDDYAQLDFVLPINLAKGVILYPTIAMFDHKDATVAGVTTDEGATWIYGITWQIDF